MIEAYVPPVIDEDEPVFVRHAGEVRHPEMRAALVELLTERLGNDLNHIQFMRGYGMGNYISDDWPEEHRALLLEWEKQTRRVLRVANELEALGTPPQPIVDAANYWLESKYKHALFATQFDSWNDMAVWRWLRARAHCARSICEFGSVYVPLNDIAFQAYFDLGLTRWPADSNGAIVERVRQICRHGGREEVRASVAKWYPLALDYIVAKQDQTERFMDMRVWTRTPAMARRWFESIVATDLQTLGLPSAASKS